MGHGFSSNLRVAMICVHSSPLARLGGKEAGGMNVYVRNLACELGRLGCAVDVFTRAQDALGARVITLAPEVRVIYIEAGPLAPCDKYDLLRHLDTFVQGVYNFAAGDGMAYDVIHSHYWISGVVALRLRAGWDIPIVQMFHTLGVMKNQVARGDEHERSERVAIERGLLGEVDRVVAATRLDKAQMIQHYDADATRIIVLPCGVDLKQFQPQSRAEARQRLGLPQNEQLILGVGRMEPLKGMDVLVRAFGLLVDWSAGWDGQTRVLLVGGATDHAVGAWNREQQRLAALRQSLGLVESVRFCGAQSHDVLPDYYAAADVVVVPSLYESFGLVALEAMACGAAVVASDAGGLSLSVEHGVSGVLVPPGEAGMLAWAIGRVLVDAQWQATLGRGARARARAYGWNQVAQRVRDVYTQVIGWNGTENIASACHCGLQECGGCYE